MACSISGVVKSVDRLELHPGALNSSQTLADVVLAKSLSALGKRPLLSRSDAMQYAVMGPWAGVVHLPVSLFMVYHARSVHRFLRMGAVVRSSHWSSSLALVGPGMG